MAYGIIKQVTEDQLDRIMRAINNEPGLEIPVYRKRNTFLIDVDVANPLGGGEKGFQQGSRGRISKAKENLQAKSNANGGGQGGSRAKFLGSIQ